MTAPSAPAVAAYERWLQATEDKPDARAVVAELCDDIAESVHEDPFREQYRSGLSTAVHRVINRVGSFTREEKLMLINRLTEDALRERRNS